MRKVKFQYEHVVREINAERWQICSNTCPEVPGCNFWQFDSQSKKCKLIDDYFDIGSSATHLLGQSKSRIVVFQNTLSVLLTFYMC